MDTINTSSTTSTTTTTTTTTTTAAAAAAAAAAATITTTTTTVGVLLFQWQCMRPGDGVSIEEGEETPEGLEKGPVGEEADALVAMDTAGPVVEIRRLQPQLGALAFRQTLLSVGLIELDGCPVHLHEEQGTHSLAMKKGFPGIRHRAQTQRRTLCKHYPINALKGCILGTSFALLTRPFLNTNHNPVSMQQLKTESVSILSSK